MFEICQISRFLLNSNCVAEKKNSEQNPLAHLLTTKKCCISVEILLKSPRPPSFFFLVIYNIFFFFCDAN